MQTHTMEPIEVLRDGMAGRRPVDGEVVSSMAMLAERLASLKAHHPLFEAICFSPDVEMMMAADAAALMN